MIENTVLPIELTLFQGKALNSYIELNWETITEINSDSYVLERSKDGHTFEFLTKIKAVGNSNKNTTYQKLDKQPFRGLNYYKLTAFDKSGIATFTKTISVQIEKINHLSIFPNPIQDQVLQFEMTSSTDENVSISIINTNGQVLWTGNNISNASVRIPVTLFPKGVYWLKTNTSEQADIQQFIIQ